LIKLGKSFFDEPFVVLGLELDIKENGAWLSLTILEGWDRYLDCRSKI